MTDHRRKAPARPLPVRILALGAAAAALVVAVVLLVVRPGGDGGTDDRATAARGGSSSTPSGGATSPGGVASPGPSSGKTGADETGEDIVTPTDLEPYVLRGSDLPPGWRTLDSASAATSEVIGACLRGALGTTVPHTVNAAAYRSGSNGPVLSTALRAFSTPVDARRSIRGVDAAVTRCLSRAGRPRLVAARPDVGAQRSVAVTFTLSRKGSSARGEVVVAQAGAYTVTLVVLGLTQDDLEVGVQAVRTVLDRIPAA